MEGTILTVAKAAAEAAAAAPPGSGLVDVLERARQAAGDALAGTPELLPVLKSAGVVDAGGAGYLLLFDAFLHVADGRPLPSRPQTGPTASRSCARPTVRSSPRAACATRSCTSSKPGGVDPVLP